jgi:uncharacterized membrane protein
MSKRKFITSIIAATAGLGLISNPSKAIASPKMEKCYGIVKAGKNDCHDIKGSHSCAGKATKDADGKEWVYLPKGACERIVGGNLEGKVN